MVLNPKNQVLSLTKGIMLIMTKPTKKDGYTWIAYTGQSGQRHSVAVGDDKTLLYGYYFVPIKS